MVSLAEKSAAFEHTLVTVEDHVATITLNRPHRRNALNYPAYDELEQSLRTAAADPDAACPPACPPTGPSTTAAASTATVSARGMPAALPPEIGGVAVEATSPSPSPEP